MAWSEDDLPRIESRLQEIRAELGPLSEVFWNPDGSAVVIPWREPTAEEERLLNVVNWLTLDCSPVTPEEEAWLEELVRQGR